VEPLAILDIRKGKGLYSNEQEVLIKWSNLADEEATWESITTIQKQFPKFELEDKVRLMREAFSGNRRMPGEELAQEEIYRLGAVGRFENKGSGEPKEIKSNGEAEDPITGSAMGLFYWEWSVLNRLSVS
jgi:high-affinity K+ transport system ATPase subunit B